MMSTAQRFAPTPQRGQFRFSPEAKAAAVRAYVAGGTLRQASAAAGEVDGTRPADRSVLDWLHAAGAEVKPQSRAKAPGRVSPCVVCGNPGLARNQRAGVCCACRKRERAGREVESRDAPMFRVRCERCGVTHSDASWSWLMDAAARHRQVEHGIRADVAAVEAQRCWERVG